MRFAWLALLTACGTSGAPKDVVGPFTGASYEFFINAITLPRSPTEVTNWGDDLDGDGAIDNQLGAAFAALYDQHALSQHSADVLAARVAGATIAIQARDLYNDDTVGLRILDLAGASMVLAVGGTFRDGVFVSNRTRGDHAGQTTLRLPAIEDADPIEVVLHDMEVDLAPDGHNGFDGVVRGLVGPEIVNLLAMSILQMIEHDPAAYRELIGMLENGSRMLSLDEIANSALVTSLLAPDITRDGTPYMSLGFAVHVAATPPGFLEDTCHNRAKDLSETGVDCGGDCLPCAGGETCGSDSDCQAHRCSGTCAAVSCTDLVRDGIESDVDCGGFECDKCASGRTCVDDNDCASGHCLVTATCQ